MYRKHHPARIFRVSCRVMVITVMGLLPGTVSSFAQDTDLASVETAVKPSIRNENYQLPLFERPASVGVHIGTQGFGVHYRVGISPNWSVRAGFSALPSVSRTKNVKEVEAEISATARFANVHLLGEYSLFHTANARVLNTLKLVFGAGVFFNAHARGSAVSTRTLNYGEIKIGKEKLGTIKGSAEWNAVAPYLGLSVLRMIPMKNLGISLDAGTCYLGKPEVNILGTKYLSNNHDLEAGLNRNLSSYRWLPVIQLSLNYRLNPQSKPTE